MVKEFTCIVCPEGCRITAVTGENGTSVSGNKCPRGKKYVLGELENPVRNISSTVAVSNGKAPVVSVKTASPIPKSMIFECMELIRAVRLEAPVKPGTVCIKNILGTGADIVTTSGTDRK